MNDWLPHQSNFLFEILDMEAPPLDTTCTSCLVDESQIRCLDCLGSPTLCRRCCLNAHQYNPYHKIEVWNGKCYVPSDLHNIGLLLHLGHGGDRCPQNVGETHHIAKADLKTTTNAGPLHAGSDDDDGDRYWDNEDFEEDVITIVHTTGVHKRHVRWCHCPSAASRPIQLLRMRLYPSSVKKPQTAFTFSVLDYFYVDSMECKTSANNFFNKLRRLTSNAFPHTVPVCHIENCYLSLFMHFAMH